MAGTPAAATPAATPRRGTRSNGALGFGRRLATETKHALKTTEFYAYVVTFVMILIAGNSIESAEGGPDRFAADKVWLYIAILTVGYMVSRGLAKAGSREPYWEDSGQNQAPDIGDERR
jgi:hypothetical protein